MYIIKFIIDGDGGCFLIDLECNVVIVVVRIVLDSVGFSVGFEMVL